MDERPIRVLLIEDDADYACLAREMLVMVSEASFDLEHAGNLSTGLDRLAAGGIDVVLLGLPLRDRWGFDTFNKVLAQAAGVPVIVLTGLDDREMAIRTIRRGAQDYLVKGQVDGNQLACAMRYAIERKRMEGVLMQQYHEMALLNRSLQALSSTLDTDRVLVTILEEVRHLLDVAACSVWLVEPGTGDLVCRQATGYRSEMVLGWRLPPGEGLAGWVADHGESLIVEDAPADERHFGVVDRETGLELRSILTVPLRVRDRTVGVLQVLDREPGRFSTADLMQLESLATAAAAAMENARLYEEAERLRALNESILQHMEEGIIVENAEGRVTFVNPKAAELLGYRPEDLLGQHRVAVVAPEFLVDLEVRGARQPQDVAGQYDIDLLDRHKRRVPVIVKIQPLFNDGQFAGLLFVLVDIAVARELERIG